jgi:catechol 2,3-dioxygenase-like lactoylglutathione lyase family enzyme
MLRDETLVAFLGISNPAAARAFYEGLLGLTFVDGSSDRMEPSDRS